MASDQYQAFAETKGRRIPVQSFSVERNIAKPPVVQCSAKEHVPPGSRLVLVHGEEETTLGFVGSATEVRDAR